MRNPPDVVVRTVTQVGGLEKTPPSWSKGKTCAKVLTIVLVPVSGLGGQTGWDIVPTVQCPPFSTRHATAPSLVQPDASNLPLSDKTGFGWTMRHFAMEYAPKIGAEKED